MGPPFSNTLGLSALLVGPLGLAAWLSACGEGAALNVPTTGIIEVVTETIGADLDPDGFTFAVDGANAQPISPVDTVSRADLEPAYHSVSLGGLAESCAVTGPNPQTAAVTAGAVARVIFRVACKAESTGSLQVTAITSGVNLDPDGYLIVLDPPFRQAITVNEVATLAGLAAGELTVRLGEVADNCSVRGDNPRGLTLAPGQTTTTTFEVTCWPPAAGHIAFQQYLSPFQQLDIVIRNADGTGSVNFTHTPSSAEYSPAWSPDGTRLTFTRQEVDGGEHTQVYVGRVSGGVPVILPGCESLAQWSRDGRLLCLSSGHLFTVRPDGTALRQLTADPLEVFSGTWSPDGSTIAFVGRTTEDPDFANFSLYTISSTGGTPTNITAGLDVSRVESASWSPDGSRIAFLGTRRGFDSDIGNVRIFVVGPDGQGLTTLPTDRVVGASLPLAWSPDGTKLAVARTLGFTEVIYVMNADGSGMRPLTGENEDALAPAWGP